MPAAPDNESAPGAKSRKVFISFSFTSMLTLVFLLVAAMTAAYIWGVMTGREQAAASSRVQIARAEGAIAQPERSAQAAETPASAGPDGILQAHELEFTNILRGHAPRPAPLPAPETEKLATEKLEVEKPAQEKPVAEAAPAPPEAGATENPGAIWDYVYQVAALKDERAVDALRQKLEGRGLRTRMERSGKVYTVMVLMRGDDSRVAELDQIVQSLRLGAPLLRGKKPVAP